MHSFTSISLHPVDLKKQVHTGLAKGKSLDLAAKKLAVISSIDAFRNGTLKCGLTKWRPKSLKKSHLAPPCKKSLYFANVFPLFCACLRLRHSPVVHNIAGTLRFCIFLHDDKICISNGAGSVQELPLITPTSTTVKCQPQQRSLLYIKYVMCIIRLHT